MPSRLRPMARFTPRCWRRSAGERRQQVKWLASGAVVTIASAIIAVSVSSSGPTSTLLDWADNLAWFGLAALPVSMGVGILRYRLYAIDRLISRTLAYAAVTALLVGVYAGLVLLAVHPRAVAQFAGGGDHLDERVR